MTAYCKFPVGRESERFSKIGQLFDEVMYTVSKKAVQNYFW